MNDEGDKAILLDSDAKITDKIEEAVAYCAQKCIELD